MGYGMAMNLRSKLDSSQTLYICNTSNEAVERFQSETTTFGRVKVVKNGAEAVQSAASLTLCDA